METETIGGYKYVVNFIISTQGKYGYISCNIKSEVFNYFLNFKTMVGKKRHKHKVPKV
jgi:hypothetical protein